jgi:Tol biopolymer transport system component
MGRALALTACLLVLLGSNTAVSQSRELSSRWRTIRSEHFAVHYPERLALLARRVLAVAERAQGRLEPVFLDVPKRRVQIVLTDETDSANGSATAVPYNTMRLFASAPDDLSVLGDYDDWMTVLITHEHAHILHFDNIGGIPAIVNKIFGRRWSPNQILPNWIIEGVATYEESAQTAGGRMRSTMFEMYMRMAVLEDNLVHFDTLNNNTDYWPQGNIWYLYGSRFVDWMVQRWGEEVIGKWAQWYGARAIPFSVNRMASRIQGFTFSELYALWIADMQAEYGQVAQQVGEQGVVEGERLTFLGQTVRGLRFFDDDRLSYYVSDGQSDPQIRLHDLTRDESQSLRRSRGLSYPVRAPDGNVYYESIDAYKTIFLYYDLFRVNPETKKRERLTKGLRARYPDVSPDGRKIAFARGENGTSSLWIADLDAIEKSKEILVRSGNFEQVFTPRFSPDGTKIAYSVWLEGGYRDIHVMDLRTRTVTRITDDRALDTGPAWSPDGKRLYFSSDRTGIANIYWWDLTTGQTKQLTNVISGAYTPAPSPDGKRLAYIGYTSRGFDIYMLDLESGSGRAAPAYVDTRPAPSPSDTFNPDLGSRYVAAPTLAPRYWGLDFQEDSFGRQLGITLNGRDVAGFHDWRWRIGVSLDEGYVNTDFRYTLRRMPPDLFVTLFRQVSLRGGLEVNGVPQEWTEDRLGGRIGASYQIPRSFHRNTVSASYGWSWSRVIEGVRLPIDPNESPPVVPETGLDGGFALGWTYSDVRQQTFDMTPSAGRSLSASLSLGHPSVGGRFSFVRASWAVRRFVQTPWKKHQVIALRYGGGAAYDSRGERGSFALGGFPDTSLLDQLVYDDQLGGVALRGYPAFSVIGDRFHLLQSEYRFPLVRVLRGPETVPVFFDRLYALIFFDWGNAYFGAMDFEDFKKGIGAELLGDFTLGYEVAYSLRLGLAYGFDGGGGLQLYVNFGFPF